MLTRRLALKKETLTALSPEDLAAVAAGAVANHTIEIGCLVEFSPSFTQPTQCCQGIPTFHRAGGAAC
jgi:hypothetical protein